MHVKTYARMIDVASRANVGLGTVSRVLNNPESVSEETRKRVMQAIEEIGYVRNQVAGSLVSNRTNVIATIVPTIGNPVFSDTIEVMSDEFRAKGLHLLLGRGGDDEQETHALVSTFLARRPDGMFLHGARNSPATEALLRGAGIPLVEAGDMLRANERIDMVVAFSNFDAGKAMTEYLIAKGHRMIGFVGRQSMNDRSKERQRGYSTALQDAGIEPRADLIVHCMHGFAEGADALLELRAREPRLGAIFFSEDVWAAGALYECQRQGWSVPGDVAVAGFDDHVIASQTVPRLTTVRVPRDELGRQAARLLLTRLDGRPVDDPVIDVGFRIVVRESA